MQVARTTTGNEQTKKKRKKGKWVGEKGGSYSQKGEGCDEGKNVKGVTGQEKVIEDSREV